jgi:pyruvate kinase
MELQVHATSGPASRQYPVLQDLIAAGTDVLRLNLSHCDAAQLPALVQKIRRAGQSVGRPVAVGADLRGRKLRLGTFPGGSVYLRAGQPFTLVPVGANSEGPGTVEEATVNYLALPQAVKPGTLILLDDGALRLRVQRVEMGKVQCTVEVSGPLPQRSGVNLPGQVISAPALTGKDLNDLDALARLGPAPAGVDLVYLSYVETEEDVRLLRQELAARGLNLPVVAKIERVAALSHLYSIAAEADSICLARGDLGVEIPLPELPYAQREALVAAQRSGKPFLLAGEVLHSLKERQTPFRGELADVVVAVEQGVSGFILSDETAVGVNPANAVRTLRQLIARAHRYGRVS